MVVRQDRLGIPIYKGKTVSWPSYLHNGNINLKKKWIWHYLFCHSARVDRCQSCSLFPFLLPGIISSPTLSSFLSGPWLLPPDLHQDTSQDLWPVILTSHDKSWKICLSQTDHLMARTSGLHHKMICSHYLIGIGILITNLRQSLDRLRFIMGFLYL